MGMSPIAIATILGNRAATMDLANVLPHLIRLAGFESSVPSLAIRPPIPGALQSVHREAPTFRPV